MKETDFYRKLSEHGKKHYDAQEKTTPHTDRFKELMNRTELVDKYFHFTNEEIEYLAKEDLPTFNEVFPDEAEEYMSW